MKIGRWWIISLIQMAVIYIGFSLAARWSLTHATAFAPDGWPLDEAVGLFLIWLCAAVGLVNTIMIGIKGLKTPDEFVLMILSCVICGAATPSDMGTGDPILVSAFGFVANLVFLFLGGLFLEFRDSQNIT